MSENMQLKFGPMVTPEQASKLMTILKVLIVCVQGEQPPNIYEETMTRAAHCIANPPSTPIDEREYHQKIMRILDSREDEDAYSYFTINYNKLLLLKLNPRHPHSLMELLLSLAEKHMQEQPELYVEHTKGIAHAALDSRIHRLANTMSENIQLKFGPMVTPEQASKLMTILKVMIVCVQGEQPSNIYEETMTRAAHCIANPPSTPIEEREYHQKITRILDSREDEDECSYFTINYNKLLLMKLNPRNRQSLMELLLTLAEKHMKEPESEPEPPSKT